MNSELKIAVGTDAFPPTTDGISNVAQNYASLINKEHGKAVIVTPKNPNQQDANYDYEIFRYKSWWFPSKEGYKLLFQAREQKAENTHRAHLPHKIRI